MARRERDDARPSWWLCALGETNAMVTTVTGCFLLYTRSAGVAHFTAGAIACSLTVKILKRCFRQPRPVVVANGRRKRTYGMPSTHSAVITYYATYICMACAHLPIHPSLSPSPVLSRITPVVLFIPFAIVVPMSRIWLGHHTWPQVGAGCAYGLIFAPVWFWLWTSGLNEYGRVVEDMVRVYLS